MKKTFLACLSLAALAAATLTLQVQPSSALPVASDNAPTDYSKWSQPALEAELQRRAVSESVRL